MTIHGDTQIALSRAVDAAVELKRQRDALLEALEHMTDFAKPRFAQMDNRELTYYQEARAAIALAKGER